MVQLLLDQGADVDIKANDGWTALDIASQENILKVLKKAKNKKSQPIETFDYKCGSILTTDLKNSGDLSSCNKCNSQHLIPSQIRKTLESLENLLASSIETRDFPNTFYHLDATELERLALVFSVRKTNIDYFPSDGIEIQIPGTSVLFVSDDKTNSNLLSEQKSIEGEPFLRLDIYFVKGKDGEVYTFGNDIQTGMLEWKIIKGYLYTVIRCVENGSVQPYESSSTKNGS